MCLHMRELPSVLQVTAQIDALFSICDQVCDYVLANPDDSRGRRSGRMTELRRKLTTGGVDFRENCREGKEIVDPRASTIAYGSLCTG